MNIRTLWSDITVQEFVIKSNGVVVKRFMGKVLVPIKTDLSVTAKHP